MQRLTKTNCFVCLSFTTWLPTFLGEKTPSVPPSSRMATPISANNASLEKTKQKAKNPQVNQNTNTKTSTKLVTRELKNKGGKQKQLAASKAGKKT